MDRGRTPTDRARSRASAAADRSPDRSSDRATIAWANGLDELRHAVAAALGQTRPAVAGAPWLLLSEARVRSGGTGDGGRPDDSDRAVSSDDSEETRHRIIALVDLARDGDAEAFGMLYDHYQPSVYRFLYYRTRSVTVAEDLTSETFIRALRNMSNFRWQGKDFGAWLMTIARNLCTDHFKAGRTRLELPTEDMSAHDGAADGPEREVMSSLTNQALLQGLQQLSDEQRDCLIMRFLQGLSIAETAAVLGRSDGAVKQLQLRAVRNLAKLVPEEWRGE